MYARRRTAVVSVATSFLVLALAPPGRASGWKVSYAFSGQDTSTATGRADQTTDWPAGPVPDPLSRTVAASASQGPNSVSVSASSIGVVTVTLTWDRAPNDMNDKPPDKIMVKQTAVATWRGQFSPLQGMTPSFQFSGSLSNGLGSPIVLTNTDLTRSGSCSGVQVLEFKSPNDYNRDAQDPITVTLPQVTIRANASGTGSGGTTSATSSLTYSAGVIDWHAHPTNFRQVDQHAYNNDDAGAPSLWFKYLWDSTSGDLADLGQVRIGEWVTYDGNAAPPGLYQYNVGNYTDIPQGPIPYGYWIPHQDPYVINGVD